MSQASAAQRRMIPGDLLIAREPGTHPVKIESSRTLPQTANAEAVVGQHDVEHDLEEHEEREHREGGTPDPKRAILFPIEPRENRAYDHGEKRDQRQAACAPHPAARVPARRREHRGDAGGICDSETPLNPDGLGPLPPVEPVRGKEEHQEPTEVLHHLLQVETQVPQAREVTVEHPGSRIAPEDPGPRPEDAEECFVGPKFSGKHEEGRDRGDERTSKEHSDAGPEALGLRLPREREQPHHRAKGGDEHFGFGQKAEAHHEPSQRGARSHAGARPDSAA